MTAAFIRSICRDDAPEPSPADESCPNNSKTLTIIIHAFTVLLFYCDKVSVTVRAGRRPAAHSQSVLSALSPVESSCLQDFMGPPISSLRDSGSAGGSDKHPSFFNTELTGETSPAPPCGQHHTLHPPPARGQSPDGESQMSFSLVIMFNVCRRDDWTCGAVLISTSFKLTVDPFITTGF